MAAKKTTVKAPTTAGTAAKLIAAAEAMKSFPAALPVVTSVSQFTTPPRLKLYVDDRPYMSWQAVADLVPWAEAFDAILYVSLSSYGNGTVMVSFETAGVVFELDSTIGTDKAYQLGAVMNRPLTRDKALSVTAAEMRSALTLIGGA
jgi:hypothetical protein